MDLLRQAGVGAKAEKSEDGDTITYTINPSEAGGPTAPSSPRDPDSGSPVGVLMIDTPLIDTKEGRPKRTALLVHVPASTAEIFQRHAASGGRFSGSLAGRRKRVGSPAPAWRLAFSPAARKTPAAAAEPRSYCGAAPQSSSAAAAARASGSEDSSGRSSAISQGLDRFSVEGGHRRCSEIIARSPCTLETVTVFFEPRPMLMTCAVRIPGGTGSPSQSAGAPAGKHRLTRTVRGKRGCSPPPARSAAPGETLLRSALRPDWRRIRCG